MRNKHYPNRTFRLDDEVMKRLNEVRKKSGKTWNLFFRDLSLETNDKNKNNPGGSAMQKMRHARRAEKS